MPVPDWIAKFQAAYSRNMLVGLARSRCSRRRRAMPIEADGKPHELLARCCQNFMHRRWCRSCSPRCTLAGRVVVRRHPPAGGRGRRGRPACSSSARPASPRRQRRPSMGPSSSFYLWFCDHRGRLLALVLVRYYWRMDADALRGAEAADRLGDAARHPHRDRAGGHPVRHHDGDRDRPRSAPPAPSCWPSRRARSTGSAPRRRCS